MRPNFESFDDNSHARLLHRRTFISGVSCALLTLQLSAQTKPARIVSTAPSITEALFALGLGDQVVGVSRYCNFPASVERLPKVGTYLSPDAEAIARLVPDLVVLQRLSSELTNRLNALHIHFVEVPHGTLNDVYTGINLVGNACGVPERALSLNGSIKRELLSLEATARRLPSPRALVIVNRRPGMLADLTAIGPDNYLQQLLEISGGSNVLAKPGLPMYPRISLETVLREDPDVILDLSGTQESEAQRQAASVQVQALWSQQPLLSAVKNGRIIVGTSNALLVPGPRAPEAARMLFEYLHAAGNKGHAG